jgi:hypothetical protein
VALLDHSPWPTAADPLTDAAAAAAADDAVDAAVVATDLVLSEVPVTIQPS